MVIVATRVLEWLIFDFFKVINFFFHFLNFSLSFWKKEKNHKFQSCSVFKYVGRAVLWLIRMGGQKKRWFLYVFFLFQLSFLNLYVVAVVSKIDFRFNCVSMQCFIFDFFFLLHIISDLSAVKKHKKLLFDLFCTVGEKDYVIELSNQQKSKMYCIHTFSTVTYWF